MTIKIQIPRRYSPYPKEYYTRHSALLETPALWNLAFLSFDYALRKLHVDPNFEVHVRRTGQTRMSNGELDLCNLQGDTVSQLLHLPAPQFVKLITAHSVLTKLPLFRAYGQTWVETMLTRSRICHVDLEPDDNIEVNEGTKLYLQSLFSGKS